METDGCCAPSVNCAIGVFTALRVCDCCAPTCRRQRAIASAGRLDTWKGGRWALPGGALDSHEVSATAAAAREALEEAGTDLQLLERKTSFLDDHGNWRYDTVTAHTCGDAGAYEDNAKSEDLQWLPIDDVAHYELHLGLRPTWLELIVHVKTRCVGEFCTIPRSCEAGA